MSGNKLFTNLLILVAVISALFIGYRLFLKPAPQAPVGLSGLSRAGFADGTANVVANDEFLNLLLSLQSIDFSEMPRVLAVLSGLEDFSTELELKDPGRNNPFAPIGMGGSPFRAPSATSTGATGETISIGSVSTSTNGVAE